MKKILLFHLLCIVKEKTGEDALKMRIEMIFQ